METSNNQSNVVVHDNENQLNLQNENEDFRSKVQTLERTVFSMKSKMEWQKRKLSEKSEKIRKLREDRDSECANYNRKNLEHLQLQKEVEEMKVQLGKAKGCISEKESVITECNATINVLREEDGNKEKKIKDLDGQLKEWKDKYVSQQSVIAGLHEKCDKYTAEIDRLEIDIGKRLDMVQKQIEINESNEAVVEQTRKDKMRLVELVCKKDEEIQILKTGSEKLVKFVEVVISSTDFLKSEQQTTLDLLEMLEAHIRSKMGLLNKFCDLAQETNQKNGSLSLTLPATHDNPSISVQQNPTHPSSLARPPLQELSISRSVVPPLSVTTSSKSMFSLEPRYKALISNVTSTLPSTSKHTKTASFTSRVIKHAEDVKNRVRGRGPDNAGAKFYCICKFECNSQLQLEQHIKHAIHDGKFECPICLKRFYIFGTWKSHIKSSHSIPEALDIEKYSCGCQKCGDMFETPLLKKRHHCTSLTYQNKINLFHETAADFNTIPASETVMEIDDE